MRILAALAVSLVVACECEPPAQAAKPKPRATGYAFRPGETLTFHVESALTVDMTGTHPMFLMAGHPRPLVWNVEGDFENVVLEVDKDGGAHLERRVREIKSSGSWNAEEFGLKWNRGQDAAVPESEKLKSNMDQYVAGMILSPLSGRVDFRGNTMMSTPGSNRLVVRQGMMYWPLRPEVGSWKSHEEIAVPVLHHKLKLVFANSVVERTGTTLHIAAPASLSSAERVWRFDTMDPGFTISGGVKAELDLASGRLTSLEIDLQIRFSGEGDLPDGGKGDLRGVVSYREAQRLVQ